jgi:hypothetical protein
VTRQARGIRDEEREPMVDDGIDNTSEREVAEEKRDMIMAETTGETEMGATASND